MRELVLYVGPSGHGLEDSVLARPGLQCRPPVRRGDIDRLVEGAAPGVVVICDGVFQSEPAVSHAELCRALDAGWAVWGVSSMGAIRAAELRTEGMRGHGVVYGRFEQDADYPDDEVCLLHFPEPPYFQVTEPLVNLRYALDMQGDRLGISRRARRALLEALRTMWFGDRTPQALRAAMLTQARLAPATADALLAWMAHHRIKTIDLADLLTQRPWDAPTPPPRLAPRRPKRVGS